MTKLQRFPMRIRLPGVGLILALAALAAAWRPADGQTLPPIWDWRLAGVIFGPGVSRALFARDGETESLQVGREIDGWTLAAIRPDGVTLESVAGERILGLEPAAPDNRSDSIVTPIRPAAPTQAAAARAQQQDQAAAEAALAFATREMMRTGSAETIR